MVRYMWSLFADQREFSFKVILRSKVKVNFGICTILVQNWHCFWNLTLTFDLEMTLSLNSHWSAQRYYIHLTIDEKWPKYIENISFSGWNNANFSTKNSEKLTLNFNLQMNLRLNSYRPAKRDHMYLTIGEMWPK